MSDLLGSIMGAVDILSGIVIAVGLGGLWIILSCLLIFKWVISFT
jgi:hypothetical protein